MPDNTEPITKDNMVERVACPDCKHAWAAPPTLPRNADPSKMLDAFYSAIPEQFGTCPERYGIGSHGTVAAAIPLCENDLMWLRGIRAAIATMHGSDSGVTEAAARFVTKLDECAPYIDSAFSFMAMHGASYKGPNYADELAALRKAIARTAKESGHAE